MAEWLKAPVLKTGKGKLFMGSNPILSAFYIRITFDDKMERYSNR